MDIDASPNPCLTDHQTEATLPRQELVTESDPVVIAKGRSLCTGKKRLREEEVDEGEADEDARYALSRGAMDLRDSLVLRPIAQARSRRPIATQDKARVQDGDFGEATFLRSFDDTMDSEV
ncbi:MAG: hypothetical protein Q9212_001675 [Teloschistes hypoglaucus]